MQKAKKPYQPRAHLSPAINPILTPENVREIRKIYRLADRIRKAEGKSKARPGLAKELAKKYGTSPSTIRRIRGKTRWTTLK